MSISEAKLAANRANAQKSTGPRTEEGKAKSARNNLRHGLLAEQTLLDTEDAAAFEEFSSALREELSPRGPWEEMLVEEVITQGWRLRRAAWMETCVLDEAMAKARDRDSQWRENQWHFAKLEAKQQGRPEADVPNPCPRPYPGSVLPRFAGAALTEMMYERNYLDVLRRYERALQRGMHESMKALQAGRAAEARAVPWVDASEVYPQGTATHVPAHGGTERGLGQTATQPTAPIPARRYGPRTLRELRSWPPRVPAADDRYWRMSERQQKLDDEYAAKWPGHRPRAGETWHYDDPDHFPRGYCTLGDAAAQPPAALECGDVCRTCPPGAALDLRPLNQEIASGGPCDTNPPTSIERADAEAATDQAQPQQPPSPGPEAGQASAGQASAPSDADSQSIQSGVADASALQGGAASVPAVHEESAAPAPVGDTNPPAGQPPAVQLPNAVCDTNPPADAATTLCDTNPPTPAEQGTSDEHKDRPGPNTAMGGEPDRARAA